MLSVHVALKIQEVSELYAEINTPVQRWTSASDIGHRPIDFAKCPFDFSVERTNFPLVYNTIQCNFIAK